jgi:hypothetical protein
MQSCETIVLALELARSHVSAMSPASFVVVFRNTFSLDQSSPAKSHEQLPECWFNRQPAPDEGPSMDHNTPLQAGGADAMSDFFTGILGSVT